MNQSERAQAYLQDEFFLDVVKKQQEFYTNNIINSNAEEVEVREMNYLKLRVLDEFIATIRSIADDKLVERKRWKVF